MFETGFFLLLAAGLCAGFRFDLRHPGARVLFRFGAYLAALALLAHSARFWFADPLSPRQLVSWGLIAGAAAALWAGRSALLRGGAPTQGIDTTTRLVTDGIYRWIRHPLYLAVLLVAAGCALKHPDAAALALWAACAAGLLLTAAAEEKEDRDRFGAAYEAYRRTSKRFLPFLF
jgi:protein-S-isoprenylcysteine O-methyltransferase Ste14